MATYTFHHADDALQTLILLNHPQYSDYHFNDFTTLHLQPLLTSKFLKAAQELLHEAVRSDHEPQPLVLLPKQHTSQSSPSHNITKGKLLDMLHQVDHKYKQYHNHMLTVISCFEQLAGIGSAKTYTSVVSQAISKQFRRLKDAILNQIQASGEGETKPQLENKIHQLQQLGMIQQSTWRPQRGLPEQSVSVLRAWLFEHFLHPYPKDSDKVMLAKQAGLTRSQVSNWFINARVRLWKPMVEEMYAEEMKRQESGCAKTRQNDVSIANNQGRGFTLEQDSVTISSEMECPNPKKLRTADTLHSPITITLDNSRDGFTLVGAPGGFGSYPFMELGRFGTEQFQPPYSGNHVSLTLGLPHDENVSTQTFQPNETLPITSFYEH